MEEILTVKKVKVSSVAKRTSEKMKLRCTERRCLNRFFVGRCYGNGLVHCIFYEISGYQLDIEILIWEDFHHAGTSQISRFDRSTMAKNKFLRVSNGGKV